MPNARLQRTREAYQVLAFHRDAFALVMGGEPCPVCGRLVTWAYGESWHCRTCGLDWLNGIGSWTSQRTGDETL